VPLLPFGGVWWVVVGLRLGVGGAHDSCFFRGVVRVGFRGSRIRQSRIDYMSHVFEYCKRRTCN
jgi:hypothetical protein